MIKEISYRGQAIRTYNPTNELKRRASESRRGGEREFSSCVGDFCVNINGEITSKEKQAIQPSEWVAEFLNRDEEEIKQIIDEALRVHVETWRLLNVPETSVNDQYQNALGSLINESEYNAVAIENFIDNAGLLSESYGLSFVHPGIEGEEQLAG